MLTLFLHKPIQLNCILIEKHFVSLKDLKPTLLAYIIVFDNLNIVKL